MPPTKFSMNENAIRPNFCIITSPSGHFTDMDIKKHTYDFDYYALLFFIISFVGWLWEVVLSYVTEHTFINRGIYKGPYLPIYGVGGLLLCLLLRLQQKKPWRVFGLAMVFCSVLEYLSSYILELRWGIRWWDYSGHFLNINGRICLLGAVTFGIGGTALVCLFLPLYEKIYGRLPSKLRLFLMIFLLLAFAADAAYCSMKPNVGYGISEELLVFDVQAFSHADAQEGAHTSLWGTNQSPRTKVLWNVPFCEKNYFPSALLSPIFSSNSSNLRAANCLPPTPNATAKATHKAAMIRIKVVSTMAVAIPNWLKHRNATST